MLCTLIQQLKEMDKFKLTSIPCLSAAFELLRVYWSLVGFVYLWPV
jgi:hypothetical protein